VDRRALTRFGWLSIAAALVTMGLKGFAYHLTGSIGLLSDAMESLVNLAGALMALAMITAAARPPDEDHAYGHSKAEYFSSVVEGTLIVIAAVSIGVAAVSRLLHPKPLEKIGMGLAVTVIASAVNLGVALVLSRAGQRERSVALRGNALHLFADVATSAGVIGGVAAVALTGWQPLDPLVALVVTASIVWSGYRLLRSSVDGLMDSALPAGEYAALRAVLDAHAADGIQYHALRTRESGARRFVSVHVLVPGAWTVHRGHALLETIEAEIRNVVPNVTILTHLESLDDPASWDDQTLDRTTAPPRT
jgi:cation diffusion facilitator family transporter